MSPENRARVPPELREIFLAQHRVATFAQFVGATDRATLRRHLRSGGIAKVWPNIYSLGPPDVRTRLYGLDLRCGEPVAACLHTAAQAYGFGTEGVTALHVLNPTGRRLRNQPGLVVHRRDGVPLTTLRGRPLTPAAWTAVDVARSLERPRALATLDAALRSEACDRDGLWVAATAQPARSGIVLVRELIPLARPGAESPMESEARLVMVDGGLPEPVLQYQVIDRDRRCWRIDFAWPEHRLAVEYDGFEFHRTTEHLRRDRQKRAALQELGWSVLSIVADDVRCRPAAMLRRIDALLHQPAA